MKRRYPLWWILTLVVLIVLRDNPKCVDACCPVYKNGHDFRIADQRILLAWDPETKIEHFVREAAFRQSNRTTSIDGQQSEKDTSDFGFLVPSPSEPQIEESNGEVFEALTAKIQPRIVRKERWSIDPFPLILSPFLLASKSIANRTDSEVPPSAVAVLQNKKVAGYEVAVLRASDANELVQWLKDNQYEARKDLQDWVSPYVEKGWIITAFKYDSSANRTEVGAVRISFATDNPVFPYRVPQDQLVQQGSGNRLQVFVVGPGRASGSLGPSPSTEVWNRGQLRFSMPIANSELNSMLGSAVPGDMLKTGESFWLTAWDDRTWPSSDKDLWFSFDAQGKPYQQVQTITRDRPIHLPIDLLGLLVVGTGLFIRRRRG